MTDRCNCTSCTGITLEEEMQMKNMQNPLCSQYHMLRAGETTHDLLQALRNSPKKNWWE